MWQEVGLRVKDNVRAHSKSNRQIERFQMRPGMGIELFPSKLEGLVNAFHADGTYWNFLIYLIYCKPAIKCRQFKGALMCMLMQPLVFAHQGNLQFGLFASLQILHSEKNVHHTWKAIEKCLWIWWRGEGKKTDRRRCWCKFIWWKSMLMLDACF